MEPHDREDDEQRRRPDPPPEDDDRTGDRRPAEGPQSLDTTNPVITTGPAFPSASRSHPDRTTVIETSRIRGPDDAFNPNFVLVPIESAPTNPARDEGGDKGHEDRAAGKAPEADSKRERHDGGDGRRDQDDQHGHSAKAPSLTRILLYCGLVALVCGVVGAWGYSYFFGPSKSGDSKSSGKDSGSKKGSDSGEGSDSGSDSGKGSDSGENADASRKGREKGDLDQAAAAWLSAVKELRKIQGAEKAARRSEEETKAVLDFLKRTLLSAGHAGAGSLPGAFWARGQAKDVTLRKALDRADSQVSEAFADRPLGEAMVRELLGSGYLNVGEASLAVKEYERALALREAVQGSTQADTAACRNQLAVAYRLAGRDAEAGRLFERNPESPAEAAALAVRGSMLLREKKPAEAELKLRESLNIRRKNQPEDWVTFDTESTLGEALLDQRKFADAEPLLLSGYRGLKEHEDAIPSREKPRVTKALERLVSLYEAWGKQDEATKWRKALAAEGERTVDRS